MVDLLIILLSGGGVFAAIYSLIITFSEIDYPSKIVEPRLYPSFDFGDASATMPDDLLNHDSGSDEYLTKYGFNFQPVPDCRIGFPGDGMPPSLENLFQPDVSVVHHLDTFDSGVFGTIDIDIFCDNGFPDMGYSSDVQIVDFESIT